MHPALSKTQEIELKLALPTSDPATLLAELARTPALARRTSTRTQLHNIYFDTADQRLLGQRMALRLRRVTGEGKGRARWLQTLKTAGEGGSALSQRGEWEAPVPGPALSLEALRATPWPDVDADGSLFQALQPSFATHFERVTWQVRRRDRSVIEVALDRGQIIAGQISAPLCELELELLAGPPQALFELAAQIAQHVTVLPLAQSKAERGYALARGALHQCLRAQPPRLGTKQALPQAAQQVLSEMLTQFCTNLNALRSADEPELVHQARVGWRRFRSAWRLLRTALPGQQAPSWQALQPLLGFVGELRDLDVARTETLPRLATAYTADDAQRAAQWAELEQALTQAASVQRKAVRYALQEPSVGAALLTLTQWLHELGATPAAPHSVALRPWARQRIKRLHQRLEKALQDADHPEAQHRARLLAKRLRYGIEALRPLLPKSRSREWLAQATDLQTDIGLARDLMRLGELAQKYEAPPEVLAFLRGVVAGQALGSF